MRVLVADDDTAFRSGLRRHLEAAGCDVLEAADGQQALEQLEASGMSVLITDVDMPAMDGYELTRRVRGREAAGYVYIIALTGLSDEDGLRRCMEAGADDFLRKPFAPTELATRLGVAERITRLQDQLAERNRQLEASNLRLRRIQDRISAELDAASRVQRALLPREDLEVPGMSLAWEVLPGEELAGDVLNVLRLDERRVAVYVLDVSGHGVPAALLSAQLSRLMSPMMTQSQLLKRRLSRPPFYQVVQPAEVVRELNQLFPVEPRAPQFFTMIYGVLELDSRVFELVTAAQPGPLLVPAVGEARDLSCPGSPVGLLAEGSWTERTLHLSEGDRMLIYSDGLPEARDPDGEPFGDPRILELADRLRGVGARECCRAVMRAVDGWCGGEPPDDDRSLLVIDLES